MKKDLISLLCLPIFFFGATLSTLGSPLDRFAREVQNHPERAVAHFNYGTALYEAGEREAAREAFLRAIRLSTDFSLSADAFYNLGVMQYEMGQEALGGWEPAELTHQATRILAENRPPMQQGRQILQTHPIQPQPQEVIQASIQNLEQRLEETKSGSESLEQALSEEVGAQSAWRESVNMFESSVELNPRQEDARHNLRFVRDEWAALKRQVDEQRGFLKRQNDQMAEMDTLIEELRKLLEDPPEQQQEDSESGESEPQPPEDSPDSGEPDASDGESGENASGEDSASDATEQPSDGESMGEEGMDPQEGDPTEDASEEPLAEEDETSPSDGGEESQPEAGEEAPDAEDTTDAGRNEEEGAGDADEADGQEGDEQGEEGTEPEEESPATAPETDQGMEPEADSSQEGRQDPIELTEEEADEFEQMVADQLGEEQEEAMTEEEAAEMLAPGVMSREEARRLLESLRFSERILPASRSAPQPTPGSDHRDW